MVEAGAARGGPDTTTVELPGGGISSNRERAALDEVVHHLVRAAARDPGEVGDAGDNLGVVGTASTVTGLIGVSGLSLEATVLDGVGESARLTLRSSNNVG